MHIWGGGTDTVMVERMILGAELSQYQTAPIASSGKNFLVSCLIDIEDVRSYRLRHSRNMQAAQAPSYHRIEVEVDLSEKVPLEEDLTGYRATEAQEIRYHTPEEEIASVLLVEIGFCGTDSHLLSAVSARPVGYGIISDAREPKAISCP